MAGAGTLSTGCHANSQERVLSGNIAWIALAIRNKAPAFAGCTWHGQLFRCYLGLSLPVRP
jgi:hypothetical protein